MDFGGGLESNDIVFSKVGDEIQSGGFSINSLFIKLGKSPLHTLITKGGGDDEEEDKLSKILYEGFAVPIGLLCERHNKREKEEDNNNDDESYSYYDYDNDYDNDLENDFDYEGNNNDNNVLSDDLYDKLLGVQRETNIKKKKRKMTRKQNDIVNVKKNKKTRKHKEKKEKEIK
jgi:hypothetical protein